ncbi:MAG: hypothetical protein E3J64_00470 [Anaerolineales bacterium]|nr:MAG: hypothetical protein E3J64_00470 [Anaerolineales bacterium]
MGQIAHGGWALLRGDEIAIDPYLDRGDALAMRGVAVDQDVGTLGDGEPIDGHVDPDEGSAWHGPRSAGAQQEYDGQDEGC